MTWIDRFVAMSPEEQIMTVVEDPSTLTALVNEAALMQDWYRRWQLARESDPPTQPADLKGPAGGVAWLACRGCGSAPGHKEGCPGVIAESMLFQALSDALSGGNAGTWDEIIHAAEQLNGPSGGALAGQTAPTESTDIMIGDVVLVGGHVEPPQFQIVTTDHERGRWEARREEINTVFRPVWRTGQHAESAVSWIPCACICGCVEVATRDGRCDICRLRESCRGLWTCEACAAGYRLASDGIHYDHKNSTWGVCRKVVASIKFGAGLRPWP